MSNFLCAKLSYLISIEPLHLNIKLPHGLHFHFVKKKSIDNNNIFPHYNQSLYVKTYAT